MPQVPTSKAMAVQSAEEYRQLTQESMYHPIFAQLFLRMLLVCLRIFSEPLSQYIMCRLRLQRTKFAISAAKVMSLFLENQ